MNVVTRFAPSPTGVLHIGSARTALFNYLFAKKFGGKFLLRIEDTDKQRSTEEATNALISALKWLGITWDAFSEQENEVYQSSRSNRHRQVALELLEKGAAYKCFTSPEEIKEIKEQAIGKGGSFLFKSPWRDLQESSHPKDLPYVIRFKAPRQGSTTVADLVHGEVRFENSTLDDIVLLRSDFEPLYNLCVFVDDHDMGVTHIIRGEDHLNNAVKQKLLYEAMGWSVPQMAHIPLIHGSDGAKLSKRHGATNVEEYKDAGYLPQAITSYILRLGWSSQSDEIISMQDAAKIFDIPQIGKSCSRIDFDKMMSVNFYYIKESSDQYLIDLVLDFLSKQDIAVDEESKTFILQGMQGLKLRAHTIAELATQAKIYLVNEKISYSAQAAEVLAQTNSDLVQETIRILQESDDFSQESLSEIFKSLAKRLGIKLASLMQPIRCLITGECSSPSVFEIVSIIGKAHSINRLKMFEKI